MKKYYIYHIPRFIHKDGTIGKIGCSEEPDTRTNNQGYTDYEILEEHECIYKASDREMELQKHYGYVVDRVPYFKTIDIQCSEARIKGGKKSGKLAVESGQLDKVRSKENSSKGGKKAGKTNVESGHIQLLGKVNVESGKLEDARKIAIQITSIPVLVYKKDGSFVGEYKSHSECARQLNIERTNVSKVCLGKAKQTKGYVIKNKPIEI